MKKFTIALAALGMMLLVNNTVIAGKPVISKTIAVSAEDDWNKAKDGTWQALFEGQTYWYKLDKNANLQWSTDGKKWDAAPNQRWADKDGRWLKTENKKLVWSTDMGVSWTEVPEWKWQASDGKWYKFDKDWNLWVSK